MFSCIQLDSVKAIKNDRQTLQTINCELFCRQITKCAAIQFANNKSKTNNARHNSTTSALSNETLTCLSGMTFDFNARRIKLCAAVLQSTLDCLQSYTKLRECVEVIFFVSVIRHGVIACSRRKLINYANLRQIERNASLATELVYVK